VRREVAQIVYTHVIKCKNDKKKKKAVEVGWLSSDLSYADMTFVPRWPFQRLSTI
jgi:hypothetical protein